MRYDYSNKTRSGEERTKHLYSNPNIVVPAQEWTKNSGKEVLQYAVGGLLYMPASNTAIAKKIISGEYDYIKSLVLDLEDSLGDDLVGFGQRAIVSIIREIGQAVEDKVIADKDIPIIPTIIIVIGSIFFLLSFYFSLVLYFIIY